MISSLKKYYKYLSYLFVHKWYVFIFCAKNGFIVRGLLHDLSKFLPSEFIDYSRRYNAEIALEESDDLCEYALAWNHHQKRNPHHWQWWLCLTSGGSYYTIKMTHEYRVELICDLYGASLAKKKYDVLNWYKEHYNDIVLHPDTRQWVDINLPRLVRGEKVLI